jgi:putative oxygen-independent coproporphyrinogen III oxidase
VAAVSERDEPGHGERTDGGYGVYVHIPFCRTRCDYCAFATWTDRHHLADAYVEVIVAELRQAAAVGMPVATSVFFGGGTPSMLPASDIAAIVAAIPRTPDAEVTVETNPDDLTPELLAGYVDGGVNRVSMGVQSTVPHVLAALGRTHDRANVERAVVALHASGLRTFNLDLIYGAVGESFDDWRTTLEDVVAYDPPHVSAYGLTVEPGTPLASDPARHPDDDEQADKYVLADELLGGMGLANYEISNWARPGHECRHNLLYWAQGNYLGVGSAAHSHQDGRRFWRVRTPERYIERVRSGASTEVGEEVLDGPTRRFEKLELALRTRDGVPAEKLDTEGLDDLVETHGQQVVLTRRGRLLANEIALRLDDR